MNQIASLSMMILLCISATWANATSVKSDPSSQVAAQVELLRKAMIEADAPMLKKLSSSDLNYGHSGGHVEDQAEFIQKIISGESDFVTMSFDDQTIKVVNDIAIVRHMLVAKTNNRGVPGEVTIGVMLIWKKQKGTWKLLARQAFKPH
jgi:hypothetical protein